MLPRRSGIALALLLLPGPLLAQVGIAARGSTLGIGAELSVRTGDYLGFRLGGNYFEFTRQVTIESNHYDATPHFENGTALIDLYPFRGVFHLSGGFILNYNEGRLAAQPPIVIDGRSYSTTEVTALIANVSFDRTAPYLGIGFAGRSRIALLVDIGVGFTGTPLVDLEVESTLDGAERAELDARVAEEEDRVQTDLNGRTWLRFHPVLSIGVKVGF